MSTIGSQTVADIAAPLLDAPVSGGPRGQRAGTLTTMVAGPTEIFARARPLLETIAQNVFHVGATPGQGQVAKLASR
jgi:3-hydroxyisobutyrate dehydrogenase-like beta-hydroxyacid dehydrogenase